MHHTSVPASLINNGAHVPQQVPQRPDSVVHLPPIQNVKKNQPPGHKEPINLPPPHVILQQSAQAASFHQAPFHPSNRIYMQSRPAAIAAAQLPSEVTQAIRSEHPGHYHGPSAAEINDFPVLHRGVIGGAEGLDWTRARHTMHIERKIEGFARDPDSPPSPIPIPLQLQLGSPARSRVPSEQGVSMVPGITRPPPVGFSHSTDTMDVDIDIKDDEELDRLVYDVSELELETIPLSRSSKKSQPRRSGSPQFIFFDPHRTASASAPAGPSTPALALPRQLLGLGSRKRKSSHPSDSNNATPSSSSIASPSDTPPSTSHSSTSTLSSASTSTSTLISSFHTGFIPSQSAKRKRGRPSNGDLSSGKYAITCHCPFCHKPYTNADKKRSLTTHFPLCVVLKKIKVEEECVFCGEAVSSVESGNGNRGGNDGKEGGIVIVTGVTDTILKKNHAVKCSGVKRFVDGRGKVKEWDVVKLKELDGWLTEHGHGQQGTVHH